MRSFFDVRSLTLAIALFAAACGGDQAGGGALDLDAEAMETAVFEMLTTRDTLDRHRSAVELADALSTENLPGAIQALDEHIDKIHHHEIRILAHAWADLDPRGALDHILEQWRYPRVSNEAIEEIVYVWAESGDGESARAYVDPTFDGPIPAPRSPTRFMQLAVLKALAVAEDWDNLTALFGSIQDPEDREFWITRVLVEMNRVNGFEPVREWIESIPWDEPEGLRISALKRALDWRSRLSYSESQAWYEEIEQDKPRPVLLEEVVKAQGLNEPANAILWLSKRAPGSERDRLIREIMSGWLSRIEPEVRTEGRAWALEHSGDDLLGPLIAPIVVASYVNSNQAGKAAEFMLQHPEHTKLERRLPTVLVRWASMDVNEVDAFIQEKGISEEVVGAYQRELKRLIDSGVRVVRERLPEQGGEKDVAP
ncbi:MAG: hypothetical protein AAGC67_03280 [Myxococcota bacterium]